MVKLVKHQQREKTLTKGRKSFIDKTMANDNDELELELDEPTGSETPDSSEAQKQLQTEIARKKHWREKFEKAEASIKELSEKVQKYESSGQPSTPVAPIEAPKSDDIDVVLQLKAEGRTDSEIITLRKYAKKMNLPISEVANDPLIKAGLDVERQKVKVEEATPSPSGGTQTVQGKTWAQMSPDERRANYDTFMTGKGSNSHI